MKRSATIRDPDTGLPQKQFALLDECYLTETEPPRFRRELFPDCTHFNVSTLAFEVTGNRRPDRLVAAAMRDPAYPWRILYADAAERTGNLAWGTHVSSFTAWVSSYQSATAQVQQGNLRRGPCPVGSGSVVT
jgi:hypothetical protein